MGKSLLAYMLRAGDVLRADRIHFATDGIQTNVLLNVESDKKELGGWEMDAFTRRVYIKPGIYAYVNDFEAQQRRVWQYIRRVCR